MENMMEKLCFTLMLATLLCAACVMTAGPHGTSVAITPSLPLVVELDTPCYVYGGFQYYFNNDRWKAGTFHLFARNLINDIRR